MNNQIDILPQKQAEYTDQPGMILGLDGWILRSVPKEYRAQFLNGYKKLLQIVFHPDRYQDATQKRSRESFLQSVDESVSFMLSDAFSYEFTVDHVPTKKNPIVTLKTAIEARDELLSKTDDILAEARAESVRLGDEVRRLNELSYRQMNEVASAEAYDYLSRSRLRAIVNKFPVPFRHPFYTLRGRWIDLAFETKVVAKLSDWLRIPKLPEDAMGQWNRLLRSRNNTLKLEFIGGSCNYTRGSDRQKIYHNRIKYAFSIFDLAEYLRRHCPEAKTPEAIQTAIKNFFVRPDAMLLARFSSPFLLPNMLVVLNQDDRFLFVHEVDAGESPNEVLIKGFRQRINKLEWRNTSDRSRFVLAKKQMTSERKKRIKLAKSLKWQLQLSTAKVKRLFLQNLELQLKVKAKLKGKQPSSVPVPALAPPTV